jgi:hypothetical protein
MTMRKILLAVTVLGLIVGSLAGPAGAAKKATTFYLHGKTSPVTEAHLNEMWLDNAWMTMDTTEPANPAPSSIFVTNYVNGPNTDCDGNGLLGALWKGEFAGNFKGDVKVTLHTLATPATQMTVSLYRDPTGTCSAEPPIGDADAPDPVATDVVDMAPGHAETVVTFKNVKFKSMAGLALQLSIPGGSPGQVRILFDSADFASSVQLTAK